MKVLVLSGGGSKGAYQAGAISYLMGEEGIRYDAFCGVSVGAINSAQMAQYKDEEVKKGVTELLSFWQKISTDQVYKPWFFGKLASLWRPSVYNSKPLWSYIKQKFDPDKVVKSGKLLRVGAVSMDSGEYKVFSEEDPDLLEAILASSAYPVMFLPLKFKGDLWSDGGIRNVTPLCSAFNLGADSADVIMCQPENYKFSPLDKPNSCDNLIRMLDIMTEEVVETDIKLALAYNRIAELDPDSGKKHMDIRIIRPEKGLPGSSLNFDEHIQEKINRGWDDAKKVCG